MMATIKPLILAYKKTEIDKPFRNFLRKYQPLGLILTQESCANPKQLQQFIADFRDCVGREDAPVSIDQEGGRAQRLAGRILFDRGGLVLKTHPGSAHWPYYPAAAVLGEICNCDVELAQKASYQLGRAIGSVLASLGIDLNFAPVIDVPSKGADPIISDRAFSKDPETVVALASRYIQGLHDFGVKSCVKHLPGHGRAEVDSHKALPYITSSKAELESSDFIPLQAFHKSPWAMVGHTLMTAFDKQWPASQSPYMIEDLLRKEYQYSGVLCTDCIWMEALQGSLPERAVLSQKAGCDVIVAVHGSLAEQGAILDALTPISDGSLERLHWANIEVKRYAESINAELWSSEYQALQELMASGGQPIKDPPVVGQV